MTRYPECLYSTTLQRPSTDSIEPAPYGRTRSMTPVCSQVARTHAHVVSCSYPTPRRSGGPSCRARLRLAAFECWKALPLNVASRAATVSLDATGNWPRRSTHDKPSVGSESRPRGPEHRATDTQDVS